MKYCEPAYSLEKTKAFLTSFCIDRHGALAAVLRESGKLVGYILFSELETGVYELGWFFNRRFWRQGLAWESCKAVIDYAFSQRNARRVFAETIDAEKSVGLMRKLGMKPEGIQADLYLYGLSEEDWRKNNGD